MRIVITSHYRLPHQGGIEVMVDALARELVDRGHDVVHVALTPAGQAAASPASYLCTDVRCLNALERRLDVPYPISGPDLVRQLDRELSGADVLHAHGFLYLPTLAAYPIAARKRIPRVLTEHVGHVPYRNPVLDLAERAAIATIGRSVVRASDAAIVFNESVRELVAGLGPATRIEWIDNGIDVDFFSPPEPDERGRLRAGLGWDGRPRVLFVGRAVKKKGLELAIRAVNLADGAFDLVVAGSDEPCPEPGVEVRGIMPREELRSLYRAVDALIVPARGEGLPLTVQEALSSGVPVVMTDDPGYRATFVEIGESVDLVRRDPAEFSRALRRRFEQGRGAVDLAAAEFSRAHFSLRSSVDRHERLYESLLGDRAERAGAGAT